MTTCCVNSQPKKINTLTGNLTDDLKALLPRGNVKADIMDEVKVLPRYQELQNKFLDGVKQHQEWFLEQQKIVEKTGQAISYHPNLGMSETEFNEYKDLMESGMGFEMVSSGTESINIKFQNDLITFSGTGKLIVLDDLSINLNEKTVMIGSYKLDKIDTINVDSDRNGLKSKWKGFSWSYESSNKSDGFSQLESMDDIKTLDMKIYKLTIGRLEKNGKTYIEITEKEISKGERTKNVEIPLTFLK